MLQEGTNSPSYPGADKAIAIYFPPCTCPDRTCYWEWRGSQSITINWLHIHPAFTEPLLCARPTKDTFTRMISFAPLANLVTDVLLSAVCR